MNTKLNTNECPTPVISQIKNGIKKIAPLLRGEITHTQARERGIVKPVDNLLEKMKKWSEE